MPATPNREDGARPVESRRQFDAILDGEDPVLAHFEAEWSRPCQRLDADLDTLAAEYGVEAARVDVEKSPVLAAEFGIRSLPTVLLFVDGEPVARREGIRDPETVADLVDSHR